MRWWAAGLFIAVVAFIATILLFIIDPVIKFALEYSLSKVTQRTVQIQSVTSKVLEAELTIEQISFIDKGDSSTNGIEIDRVNLKLNSEHLLEKKLDFEIISFGNIKLNQSLIKSENSSEESADKAIKKSVDSLSSIETPELPKPQDLIAKEGLKSVAAAKEIQKNITDITQKWSKFAQGDGQKEKIVSIEKKIKSLEKKANNVKSPEQILTIVKEADALKKELEAVNKEITQMSSEYKKDKKTIERHMKEIQTLPMQDYNQLANKYSFDQNGAMNFIGTYFSSSLEKYLRMGSKYYEMAKPYISSEEEELTPEQERMRGRWIKYANTSPYPDFVIRKLNANVIMNQVNYDLIIKDISDDQKVYNKPLTGIMTSTSSDYKLFKLDFEHNELGTDILTSANSIVKGYKLPEYSAIDGLSINDSLIDESSTLVVTDFKNINANIAAEFVKTALVYSASSSMTDKAIADILSNITNFSVDASVGGTLDEPQIGLKTDLDKKIAKGLKSQ
ncbi:MAG: TIGR03545 family protein, partial [Campylobacterota bacterium]|nr:TIGR03545 family protein [Campylobacterota bacterium]